MMVHAADIEDEFDLEKIDVEMKMEKIRQSGNRLSWDGFGQSLRRNLMEKRCVFDAEGRIDVAQAIGILKRNVPVDEKGDLSTKLKQLADGLSCDLITRNGIVEIRTMTKEKSHDSKNIDLQMELKCEDQKIIFCKIGYYERPAVACVKAANLINSGDFCTLRSGLYGMLARIPNFPNRSDKMLCVSALEKIETWLSQLSGDPTFDKVVSLPVGWFCPSDGLRLSRIYYVVEPCYTLGVGRRHFDLEHDLENLPYLELSMIQNDKETELPTGPISSDIWSSTRPSLACFCIRFSVPLPLSRSTWERLEKYLARASVVRQHINIYRYTSRFDFKDTELVLRTNMPSHLPQHCYTISSDYLKEEHDMIIGELYIKDMRHLDKVVSLIRAQQMHNSLWESFLSMSVGTWTGSSSVKMKVHPSSSRFEVQFSANDRIVVARFIMNRDYQWSAVVEGVDGVSINADIDREVTTMLLKSRSIPCALTRVTSALACRGSPDPADAPCDFSSIVSRLDKVGDAWLPVLTVREPKMQHIYEVENDFSSGGLLSSFKDLEESSIYAPLRTEAAARNTRQQSDTSYAHAFTDLEAICQIAAEPCDGDSKSSTPILGGRHESSPAPRNNGLTQLSPLETARLRMAHSVGAVSAAGLAAGSPDVFDFADDRSAGSGSSFPSPSPVGTQFGFPATSPLGSSVRGGVSKRRPRGRKTANFGDRTSSSESVLGQEIAFGQAATKKPRGRAPVRRPRGTRKSSGLPVSHSEMEAQRPTLQRSFSDYAPLSTINNPLTPSEYSKSPVVEEDTDEDECDPPPPPKGLISLPQPSPTSASMRSTQSVSSPIPRSPLSSSDGPANPPTRVQPVRKNSMEAAVLPKPKANLQPLIQQRRAMMSDLYDDGADSPPPPEERIPSVVLSSTHQSAVQAASRSSPQLYGSPRGDSNSCDGFNVSTPPSKPEGSKLIIKIPKAPSRGSPSVDVQKSKSMNSSMPKLEKRKKESRDKDRDKERSKDKEESKRKRKAESGRDKEHKRHKSASSSAESSKIPPPSPVLPFTMNALKNFKIPKREDAKDSPKEKESPTPSAPALASNLISPSNSSSGSSNPKSILKKNSTSAPLAPNALPPQLPRPGSYGMPGPLPSRKPAPVMEQRRSTGMPPSSHLPANIPLPKGPPPPPRINATGAGAWVRPPTLIPAHVPPPPRSPSPDPNAMQIDDDANSPEDSLRIADD